MFGQWNLTSLALLLLLPLPVSASEACRSAVRIPVNSAVQSFRDTPACFELQPLTAGNLWIEVGVPAWSEGQPRLELEDCSGAASNVRLRRQLPDSLALEIRGSEDLIVCIYPQDPQDELGDFVFQSVFQPSALFKDGGDPNAQEPDPHPLVSPPRREVCEGLREDDHGDIRFCAASLAIGETVSGRFDKVGGWDRDVFVISITEMQTLCFATSGDSETFGVLTDRSGYYLAREDSGGEGENFRLVKTLTPGQYFLKVDGRNGDYHLTVEVVPDAP